MAGNATEPKWDRELLESALRGNSPAQRAAWESMVDVIDSIREGSAREPRSKYEAQSPFQILRGRPGNAEVAVSQQGTLAYGKSADTTSELTVTKRCNEADREDRFHAVQDGSIIYIDVTVSSDAPTAAEVKVATSAGWTDYPDPVSISGAAQTNVYIPLGVVQHNATRTKQNPLFLLPGGLLVYQLQSSDILLEPSAWDYIWVWVQNLPHQLI